MQKIYKNILIFVLTFSFFILPLSTFCLTQTTSTGSDKYGLSDVKNTGLVTSSPTEVVGRVIQTIIGIVGVILVVVFIYGGVLYMTSGGNEDKVATAKKAMTYGIIGVVIIALAFALTRFILDALIKQ